jgi:mevalonate kinase
MESFGYAAPGKAILFGEHFVVYGARAVMCAIDRRVVAESCRRDGHTLSVMSTLESADLPLDAPTGSIPATLRPFHHIARSLGCGGATLRICSEVPAGAGLGSSSACCVAAAGSLAALSGMSVDIMDLAVAAERSSYPGSSGADCAACMRGGVLSYVKGAPSAGTHTDDVPSDLRLVIADSGIIHNTKEMVDLVGRGARTDPAGFTASMARANTISSEALEALAAGDIPGLGRLATENQALLETLGVSNGVLRHMVRVADRHSYGSKITGAGGGGCIVAMADPSNAAATVAALAAEGYNAFEAQISAGARPVHTL